MVVLLHQTYWGWDRGFPCYTLLLAFLRGDLTVQLKLYGTESLVKLRYYIDLLFSWDLLTSWQCSGIFRVKTRISSEGVGILLCYLISDLNSPSLIFTSLVWLSEAQLMYTVYWDQTGMEYQCAVLLFVSNITLLWPWFTGTLICTHDNTVCTQRNVIFKQRFFVCPQHANVSTTGTCLPWLCYMSVNFALCKVAVLGTICCISAVVTYLYYIYAYCRSTVRCLAVNSCTLSRISLNILFMEYTDARC